MFDDPEGDDPSLEKYVQIFYDSSQCMWSVSPVSFQACNVSWALKAPHAHPFSGLKLQFKTISCVTNYSAAELNPRSIFQMKISLCYAE